MNNQSSEEKYESLESALKGWYEKPFDELPEKLKARVKRAFKNQASMSLNEYAQPVLKFANQSFYDLKPDVQARLESNYDKLGWDENSSEYRLTRARVWDGFHDPSQDKEDRKEFDKLVAKTEKEALISETEAEKPKNLTERYYKEELLEKYKRELKQIESGESSTSETNESPKRSRDDAISTAMNAYMDECRSKSKTPEFDECWRFVSDYSSIECNMDNELVYPIQSGEIRRCDRKKFRERFKRAEKKICR